MFRRLYFLIPQVYYSFPLQLLFTNIKRNHVLMLCWVIMFAMVTGSFGKYLGIPYLFLDPEYLNKVNFNSFFIIGLVTAGFTTAFHITCYITDGHRFSFIGTLPKPFTKFAINNSLVPLIFFITYVYQIISFQINNEYTTANELAKNLAGLVSGYVMMTAVFVIYFWITNKDIFKYVVCRIDEKIKQNVKITRANAMQKLDIARKKQVRVDSFLDYDFKVKPVEDNSFYDKATVLQVFDQNHFNLVVIEVFIFLLVLLLGIFKDVPAFQLPAAASFIIFLTIFVMIAGAFSYWFGGWSGTVAVVLFLVVNHLVGEEFFSRRYEAFGLAYYRTPAEYSVKSIKQLNNPAKIARDKEAGLYMLENWRNKFPQNEKPKLVMLCVSGGGKRAALWTLNTLQHTDSITHGNLMKNCALITGASGGLIGASYYRELKLQELLGNPIAPYSAKHRTSISSDNLNPLIFSLLANDLFVGFNSFEYLGNHYYRDRGYTFEEQLNQITEHLMDKPIWKYDSVEQQAMIPLVILSPTVVNDGRKLYIAARSVTYMNSDIDNFPDYPMAKVSGVDFQSLFEGHDGRNLRFLSALRMSATFPYITPNTTLPTDPPIKIMDAGISDNFGLSDGVRFLFAFKEWIAENTSGVIFVSVRDSPKLGPISADLGHTIIDDITQPISSVYNNFENFQDINSDMMISHARTWFKGPIHRIDIQYHTDNYISILQKMDSIRQNNARASLSWRLTTREKVGIENAIFTEANQQQIRLLSTLLE